MKIIDWAKGLLITTVMSASLLALPSEVLAAISISWEQDDEGVKKTAIYRSTNGTLSVPDPNYFLVEVSGSQTSYRDTSALSGTRYYYTLFNVDDQGNYSDPASVLFSVNDGELLPPEAPVVAPESIKSSRVAVTVLRLNVRSTPNLNAPIVAVVLSGAQGEVVADPLVVNDISWIQVKYDNGVMGWSARQYLNIVGNTNTLPVSNDAARQALIRQLQQQIIELTIKLIALIQAQSR